MVDFNYFRAFDDVDGLVDTITVCCKKAEGRSLCEEDQMLISLILNKRRLATLTNYSSLSKRTASLISQVQI
ncbi:hypothetical protein FHT86_000877 [Rhizobium sp. BK313]|nr:hypothetical protein [Rhizobium sp. BK313]